jgi:hypothetical protein
MGKKSSDDMGSRDIKTQDGGTRKSEAWATKEMETNGRTKHRNQIRVG